MGQQWRPGLGVQSFDAQTRSSRIFLVVLGIGSASPPPPGACKGENSGLSPYPFRNTPSRWSRLHLKDANDVWKAQLCLSGSQSRGDLRPADTCILPAPTQALFQCLQVTSGIYILIQNYLNIKSTSRGSPSLVLISTPLQSAQWQRICLQCRSHKRCRFGLWVREIPWRRAW